MSDTKKSVIFSVYLPDRQQECEVQMSVDYVFPRVYQN